MDCRVYARAAAWIAGADRWGEARWADLEAQARSGAAGLVNRPPTAPAAKRRSDWLGNREGWLE